MALVAMSASAQVKFNRTFAAKKKTTVWYLRAGMNANSYRTEFSESDAKDHISIDSKIGYELAFGFNKPFGKSNVYWGMELGSSSKGFDITINEDENIKAKENIYSYYAPTVKLVPFMVGYKYPITDDFKIDAHLGAFASLELPVKDYEMWYHINNGEYAIDFEGDFESPLDCGFQIGIGVWYKKLNLDLIYQMGFINTHDLYDFEKQAYSKEYYYRWETYYSTYSESFKNSAFLIRLGIAF